MVSDLKANASGASDTASMDARMEENYRRLHACYHRCPDENDLRPSEARARIIGGLDASLSRQVGLI